MQAKAHARYVRISSRKVKLVIDLIRGKKLGDAIAILRHTPKAASPIVEKLVLSAAANAENNHGLTPDALVITEIFVNQGPTLKRFRAGSMGRGSRINKRTSHISVVLTQK
jgi:large subunit ribosomal protein L22